MHLPGHKNEKMKKKVLLISFTVLYGILGYSQESKSLYPYGIQGIYQIAKESNIKATSASPESPIQDSVTTVCGGDLLSTATTKRDVLAFRTNLLLPLLNAGLEIPIARHFSIAGDIYYPWIGYDKTNANCLQALLTDVQLRWWISPKKIEGHRGNTLTGSVISLGAYAGYYDLERNMKGFQGEIGGLYLDYGYSFYLGTHCRLALSVGFGIAQIPYRTYTVYSEGGKLFRDNSFYDINKQWIGPLHAGLVLSIPITGGKK